MHGVGRRGWASAFSAAVLVHAGIALFVLRQEPEPGIPPDAKEAAILLGQHGTAEGDLAAGVEATLDAELVGDVEGADDVAPREAAPTPPETAPSPLPEDVVALAALEADTRPPAEAALPTDPTLVTPPSPAEAVEPAAPEAAPRPPSETAISTIPEPAMLPSPADAALVPTMQATGYRPPRETASTPPPQPATPGIPKDTMTLAALQTETRPPPETSIPAPPPPATSPLPEDIAALTASELAGVPRVEEAPATLPEPEAPPSVAPLPAEIVEGAGGEAPSVESWEPATEVPVADEALDEPPLLQAFRAPPVSATHPSPEEVPALAASEAASRPPPEEATPSPSLVATLSAPREIVALSAPQVAWRPPVERATPTPPPTAASPPLEEAEVLAVIEAAGHVPVAEAVATPPEPAQTSPLEPEPAGEAANDSPPDPARLVAAEIVVSASVPEVPETLDAVESAELAPPSAHTQEAVPDIDEAGTLPPPPEATVTPPAPATSPPLEEAPEVAANETAGRPRPEEAVAAPPAATEFLGPVEEVAMRDASVAMEPGSALPGSESQETPRTRGADAGAGTAPAPSEDAGAVAGRAGYLGWLKDRLFKRLTYPHRARAHRQTGTASVYIEVHRSGRVESYELRARTGHELLDREVEAMVERARPFPAFPEEMRQERLELLLNVEFVLE